MNLTYRRVRYGGRHYRNVRRLYLRAFPDIERIPLWLLSLMSLRPDMDFYAIYDGDEFCGLLYLIRDPKVTLIFYFAVRDDLRGRSYGTEILKWLRNGKGAVALIMESMHEQCDNMAQRRRREEFYLRNGFMQTGFYMGNYAGIFDILSTEPQIDPMAFKKLMLRLVFWEKNLKVARF